MTILSAAVGAARMTAQIAGAIGEINQVISNGKKAEESLEGIGNSAKVASAEVQKLPGKFAELFGAIQSGQASAGTFLKFGADLVQSFGGVGAAARGVMSLVTPFNAAVAAAGLLAEAYKEGSKEADQYARVIALTGNAAGTSVSQLQAMADGASRVTGSQAKAAEVLAALAGTGQVASGDLEKFAVTAIQMERNVGVSVADTVKHFAELGASPVEASRKLNSQYGYLTASVYSQIKALKEQGDTLGAAGLAQQTYERAMANVSTTMEGRLGLMERSWRALGNVAAKAWDKMLNIGREDGVQQQLADTSARIAVLKEQTAGKGPGIVEGEGGAAFGAGANVAQARRLAELKMLEERRAFLQESVRLDKRGAEARAQRNQDEKDAQDAEDKIAQRQAKGLSEKQKLKAALNDYDQGLDLLRKVNPKSDALNPEAMARGRQSIIDEFTRKRSGGPVAAPISVPDSDAFKQYTKTMAEFSTISSSAVVQTENLSKTQAELRNIQGSPVWAAYSRQQQEQIILAASLSQADEDRAKAAEEAKKKLNQAAEAQRQETVATVTAAAQAETELANYGLLKSQVQELALTKLIAARDSEALAGKDVSEIEKRIDAQKRLVAAAKGIEAAGTKAQAAKEQEQEWKRTSESINKSLTDAFMKSLESGKDFGKNLGNALKEQFKSLVLKPTVSAIMSPISGMLSTAVSGIMGGGGPGNSGTLGNLLSLGQSAYGAYTGTGPLAAGWNALSSWAGLGGAASTGTGILVSTGGATTVGSTLATGAQGLGFQAASANFASGIGSTIPGMTTGSTIAGTGGGAGIVVNTANPALGSLGTGGGAGAAGTSVAAVAGWLALVAVIGNMMGVFQSETKVGEGLRGTLTGNRDDQLRAWEETRYGGTFINGPEFETMEPLTRLKEYKKTRERLVAEDAAEDAKDVELRKNPTSNMVERDALNQGRESEIASFTQGIIDLQNRTEGLEEKTRMQSKAIQEGYKVTRDGVIKMTENVGLSTESIKNFGFELDTQDLNFQGLNPQEIQAKIVAALDKSANKMAEGLLGHWEEKQVEVEQRIWTNVGGEGQQMSMVFEDVTKTLTKTTYVASEFAKDGEKPIQTLTRLSNSFTAVNDASEAMGFGLHTASLAAADFASDVVDAFGSLERFSAITGSFIQNFYTPEEQREAMANQGSRSLKAAGVNVSAEQLLGGSRDSVKTAMQGWISSGAAAEDYAPVMEILNSLAPLWAGYEAAAPAVENLSNAVDELTQKFNGAKDALLNDAKSLSVDLLRAQGKEGEAKALERTNYLAGFSDLDEVRRQELGTLYDINTATRRAIDVQNERNGLQTELNSLTDDATQALTRQRDALDESNRALFDNVQAVKLQKTIAEELPGVVDKYLSPAQRRQSQYDKVASDLNAAGLKVSADQLMGVSKAQIGAAAVEIYNLAGVSDEARLAIVRAAGALADLKDADVDNAFAALERAVDAQRTVLNEAIAELTTVFETARDAAKSLFGEVESAVQFQGDEGRAFISNALSVARTAGYLPDSKEFSKAVSDATGALGQQMFATQAESDYQRLVLANELKGLQDISGDQLEKAKTQLETLEEQLKVQRQQVEALGGIDASVLSVEQVIDRLATAMNGAQATPRTPTTTLKGAGGASYDLTTGTGQTSSGVAFSGSAIKEAALKAISEGASPQQIYNIIRDSGFTVAQAEQMAGSAPGSLQKLEAEMGWAAAYGGTGSYSKQSAYGASALAEPTAYDPTAAGNGNQQIVSALQDVRAELIEVRRQNDQLQYAATRTADAVNGRPEAPMLVENV